jgi:hypothetical protein
LEELVTYIFRVKEVQEEDLTFWTLKVEATRSSEISGTNYQLMWCLSQKMFKLYHHHCEKLRSQMADFVCGHTVPSGQEVTIPLPNHVDLYVDTVDSAG